MIKYAFFVFSIVSSGLAAAAADPCDVFMKCGTYEGPGRNYDENNRPVPHSEFTETLTVSSKSDLVLNIKQSMRADSNGVEFYNLDLDIVFQPDGTYVAQRVSDGRIFAAGICQTGQVCTLSMIPFAWNDKKSGDAGVTGNVNILRFENRKLYRTMMASPKQSIIDFQRSEMTKK